MNSSSPAIPSTFSLVVLGDVGVTDDVVHIGDEAMFDEFVQQARARDIRSITGVSSAPAETAGRYDIDSVHKLDFSAARTPTAEDRAERVRRILAVADGDDSALDAADPARPLIDTLRTANAAAVSGGGNLSSIWPEHIDERCTFGMLAAKFGVPLVVSGQTIGPILVGDDRDRVATLLGSAALVSLREGASFQLVRDLGVPMEHVHRTVDDASFLGATRPAVAAPDLAPYILVTLASHVGDEDRDAAVPAIAALLDAAGERWDAHVLFHAHFGSTRSDVAVGDTVMHERVIAAMTSGRGRVVPTRDSADAAALARGAQLVISSRYHPAVFATAAGVPTIGISVDGYTHTKLTGALGNFGQESGVLPLGVLLAGGGEAHLQSVWLRREEIRAEGSRLAQVRSADSTRWWDDAFAALGVGRASGYRWVERGASATL